MKGSPFPCTLNIPFIYLYLFMEQIHGNIPFIPESFSPVLNHSLFRELSELTKRKHVPLTAHLRGVQLIALSREFT